MLLNNHNSPAVLMGRCGFTQPKKGFSKSLQLADLFLAKATRRGILAEYDLSYNGSPHAFSYTEMFVNAGGLYVRPCDSYFRHRYLTDNEWPQVDNGYRDFILTNIGDKYSSQIDPIYHSKKVVILPGSNILKTIAKNELIKIAEENSKIIFKPHPLILEQDYVELCSMLAHTDAYVMASMFSGMYLVERAEEVFTLRCSEVGVTAGLMGKKVSIIPSREITGPYHSFYEAMFGGYLWDYVESPKSGLFLDMPGVEDRMEEYLDAYQRFYNDYRAGSSSARPGIRP